MGKFEKGILGPFSGKVGPVVGGDWNGISYMRSRPGRRKGKASAKQEQQQAKFSLVSKFLKPLKNLLAMGFQDGAVNMSGFNSAFRYHMQYAVAGVYPDYTIDYAAVMISKGGLLNVHSANVQNGGDGRILVSWADNSGAGDASSDDACILAAYCPELKTAVYNTTAALRGSMEASLQVSQFAGKEVHVYLSFATASGNRTASSLYLGGLVVQ
ncbi:DUF6266 family protein [Foetidibacter luteolus]|uniref:DUF6266 family protein n=1 Tax=Foetidibacter luteolus TaxID=2608880 RepID=UPI00129A290A|nr:DUF6266 family protein [Foetidibacter luteolus]